MKVLLFFFPSWKLGHLPASGFLGLSSLLNLIHSLTHHIYWAPGTHKGTRGVRRAASNSNFTKWVRCVFGLGLEIWTPKGAAACPPAPAFLLSPLLQNIPDLLSQTHICSPCAILCIGGELSGPSEFCLLSEAFTEICPSRLHFVIFTSDLRLLSSDLFKFWNPQKHPGCLGISDACLPIPVVVSVFCCCFF